jgi:hypothetical protein
MRRLSLISILALSLFASAMAHAETTSALIGQAMDKQLPKTETTFDGTLPQAIQMFGDETGVPIVADDSVYEALPWGDLTTFHAVFKHQTLRQSLTAICQRLGLDYEIQDQNIYLRPLPALVRLGRRSTVEELQELDFLSRAPLDAKQSHLSASALLDLIDSRLEKSAYTIQDRAFAPKNSPEINIARNSTLADALNEIDAQTNATWYPWGKGIVVLKKSDQIRMQLSKRITLRISNEDVTQVLLDLSQRTGVAFQIEPGAIQKIDPQYRTIRLSMENATGQQALESIAGFTGLGYRITDDGVSIFNALSPTAAATTQPNP